METVTDLKHSLGAITRLPSELASRRPCHHPGYACAVTSDRLRLLTLPYCDFEGQLHDAGQLIVLDAVAEAVLSLFNTLFAQRFPIASMQLLDQYQYDDNASMAANNTSAFNCRLLTNQTDLSLHAYGVAIDINPIQNPYLVCPSHPTKGILPPSGAAYRDRARQQAGMVEPIVDLLAKHGFTDWGGHWSQPVDYHHFQVPRSLAAMLVALPAEEAKALFHLHQARPTLFAKWSPATVPSLLERYRQAGANGWSDLVTFLSHQRGR